MAFQHEILRRANTMLPSTLLARLCCLKGIPPASVLATAIFENLTHTKLPAADERLTSIGLKRQQAWQEPAKLTRAPEAPSIPWS
jgi:hypothetical protein